MKIILFCSCSFLSAISIANNLEIKNIRVGILSGIEQLDLYGTGIVVAEKNSFYQNVSVPRAVTMTIRRRLIQGLKDKWVYEIMNSQSQSEDRWN